MSEQFHYLDTSVVLAWLLEGSDVIRPLEGSRLVASSRLLWTEVARGLHRALQTERLSPVVATAARHRFTRLATSIASIRLTESVLRRAEGPYPVVVRTLDALHLASAELWLGAELPAGDPGRVAEQEAQLPTRPGRMSVWSLDTRMNQCAALLGFATPLMEHS